MTLEDIQTLRQDGWSLDVLTVLESLGYELASYDATTCEAHFATSAFLKNEHGFTLHRQDSATKIRHQIFEAGVFAHEKRTRDALTTLGLCAGLRLA